MKDIKTPDGKIHKIQEMDFEVDSEPWIRIKVEDGSVLKFRTTIVSVAKSDQRNEKGEPTYFINGQNQMQLIAPDSLCETPEPDKIEESEHDVSYR